MTELKLRKINVSDKKYFAVWWRNRELLKLTSGILRRISDQEVDRYFQGILKDKKNLHFLIVLSGVVIGHVSLSKRRGGWYETQIIIGDRGFWGKGYGAKAISLLVKKAKRLGINKIYLEVRPTNTRAIRAYEKCGFIKVKIISYPLNHYLPRTLRMELR